MNKTSIKIVIFLMIFAHGIYTFKQSYEIGFSVTPSLPYTVFLINKKNLNFKKNDLIVFKYPGENIYNFKKNEQFVKVAICLPGDLLHVNDNLEYFCNGKKIGTAAKEDSQGKLLKHFYYSGQVPEGKYFVIGTHPKSWDSKYWGFVEHSSILATAVGIF